MVAVKSADFLSPVSPALFWFVVSVAGAVMLGLALGVWLVA